MADQSRPPITTYTVALSRPQADALRSVLADRGYRFAEKPYTLFAASSDGVQVAVYEKGPKVVVQGKATADFVQFVLEPEILGEAKLGYEEVLDPEMFSPHAGVDESGKGDYFGPLVIAAAYTDPTIARALIQAGVRDSKNITSDARIRSLAEAIRRATGDRCTTVRISPAKYNQLIGSMGNVNSILGWGHARAIENLLERVPDCPRALSDQFANPRVIQRALLEKGRRIVLQQRTKGESDIAVAAASILAREAFIDWLSATGKELGFTLPRGASAAVVETAKRIVAERGPSALENFAKLHFRTTSQALGTFSP